MRGEDRLGIAGRESTAIGGGARLDEDGPPLRRAWDVQRAGIAVMRAAMVCAADPVGPGELPGLAVVEEAPNADVAADFVAYVVGSEGQATLKDYGFEPLA